MQLHVSRLSVRMEVELAKYEVYRKKLKSRLLYAGVWPNSEEQSKIMKSFMFFLSIFTLGFITFTVTLFCLKFIKIIPLLTRGLCLVIGFGTGLLKACIMAYHEKDITSLNNGLSAKFTEDLKVPENRSHLLSRLSTIKRFFYLLDYSIAMSATFYNLLPLWYARKGKFLRIYPQVFPFGYEPERFIYSIYHSSVPGSLSHWILYAFEILTGWYLWTVSSGVDSSFGYFTLHMVGELRLLSHKFRQLKTSQNYKKDLKDCIDRHNLLVKSQYIVQDIFGFLALWFAVTTAIVLCTLTFQVFMAEYISPLKIVHLTIYISIKIIQAYSIAWFGTTLASESQACLNSIYESCWPGSGDVRFMHDVLIVLSQKPFIFMAKGVMRLEMIMFQRIINTTVSYVFLLRALEETLNRHT